MSTIVQTRDAVVAAICTTGIRTVDHPIDSPSPPMCIVSLDRIDYGGGGMSSTGVIHNWTLTIVVGRSNARGGWDSVSEYLDTAGDKSIRAALLADQTLDGVVSSLWIGSTLDIGTVALGSDTSYIIATLELQTHAI